MSLAAVSWSQYANQTQTQYGAFSSSVSANVAVNYVQCLSSSQVAISTYHNYGTTGTASIYQTSNTGTFGQVNYSTTGGNRTESTTVSYSSQIIGRFSSYAAARYGIGNAFSATATIDVVVNFVDATKGLTLVTSSGYYIVRLPSASTCIGQLFFVKNDADGYVAVSTISTGEVIDGLTLNQLKLARGACVCVSAISSTQWSILTYWSGTDGPIAQQSSYPTTTQITSPIVTVDIGSVDRWLGLPDPATWGKGNFLIINAYQTSMSAPTYTCYVPVAPYSGTTGSLVRNELPGGANEAGPTPNCYVLKPAADKNGNYDHNASLILISDGTLWNNVGFFNGAGCYFDRYVPSATLTTGGIVVHSAGALATTHSVPVSVGNSRLYFTKMNGASTQDYGGFVSNLGKPSTLGVIGTFKTYGTRTGSMNGDTMTLLTSVSIPYGTTVTGTGVADGTYVISGSGTTVYSISPSQSVDWTTLTFRYGYGRFWKHKPDTVDYTGYAMCQVNVDGSTVHFPVAMYPSSY